MYHGGMDTLITTLLAAIPYLADKAAAPLVKDAYDKVKLVIKDRFGRDHQVNKALQDWEANPNSPGRQMVLQEMVDQTSLALDAEIVRLVGELGRALQQVGPAAPVNQVQGETVNIINATTVNNPVMAKTVTIHHGHG
ncbi:MAG: hypothetical protein H7833_14940 [Magnetococcus sp. DMHC-1]